MIPLSELVKYFVIGSGIIFLVFLFAVMRWDAKVERERTEEYLRKMREDE